MTFLTEASGPPVLDVPTPSWIFDRVQEWANRSPHRIAFILDNQNTIEEYRYPDVLDRASCVAAELQAKGIQRGDRIGILMENVPEWVFVLFGAMKTGAITVPLATALPENSIRLIAEHAGCRLLFADDGNWEKASHVAQALGCEAMRASELSRRAEPRPEQPSASDTALLIYTSGTTGDPKGVELTLDNLNYEVKGVVESLQLTPDHRILSVLPFSHVLPLIANALGPLCIGATVVFLSSISPQRIVDAFHRHRITLFVCVPQFFYILHKRIFSQVAAQPFLTRLSFGWMKRISKRFPGAAVRRRMFAKIHKAIGPDLKILASGGSHFDPAIAHDLSDLGYTVLQAYGLTETSAAATVTPGQDNRIGTVGKPIRGVTVRVNEPNEKGIGEVLIRGPIVMKGYYRAPSKTAEAVRDGWFYTGDLGFLDHDGNLSITGRSKDVIVLANGENVYPEEMEAHYSKSSFIKEICILGLPQHGPDPASKGGVLHAIVVPDIDEFRRRGQTAISETVRFDIENLSKELPSYYRIHSLEIRNEPLPRTVTRKLKRFEIQQQSLERQETQPRTEPARAAADHPRFQTGIGRVIAELVRETKHDGGALDPSMNLELDLGFDSLGRVELLGLAETRLGAHVDEQQASRIFTLGELMDAFEAASDSKTATAQSWKEIIQTAAPDQIEGKYVFAKRPLLDPISIILLRTFKLAAGVLFRMRCFGLEKLPPMPFLLCPNHESFIDGPLLVSILPRHVIHKVVILGYSDYWQNSFSRRLAELCRIVPIDPNVNLIRAMQAGAAGLKQGRCVLIFPEGTRSIDGHVADFKKGAAILSYELGAPIVPIGIRGSFEVWPRGGSFRLHPIEFHFGTPIYPKAFSNVPDPYTVITEALRNEVKALSDDKTPV